MRRPEPSVGLDEVAELRSLLRRRDIAARQLGLALLRSWGAHDLCAVGARAVLEAAADAYPSLPGDHDQPAELLAQLLWGSPNLVPVTDVLRVFVPAGERARRALLHLLAIRGGPEGLSGLEFLLGAKGPTSLVPVATAPLLEPLLFHAERARVTDLLCDVLDRPGWTWHAADLLRRSEVAVPGDDARRARILDALDRTVVALVEACDRAALVDPRSGDASRSERAAIVSTMPLLDELREQDQGRILLRLLASADPRISVMGAVRLLWRGEPLAPERLELIARDPVARADLHDALQGRSDPDERAVVIDEVEVHEGRLARWLSDVTELGRAPDEIEHVVTLRTEAADDGADEHGNASGWGDGRSGPLHVYRFRMRSPHWSAGRGWMVGAAGDFTYSCYAAEDECSVEAHVRAMRTALAEWPDRRADGAA